MSAQVTLHCDRPGIEMCEASFSGGYGATPEFVRKAAEARGWRSDVDTVQDFAGTVLVEMVSDYCPEHNR